MLVAFKVRDVKTTTALIVSLIALMFLMQIFFYYIIPISNNYQPTPTLPKMQIFDLAGKFQVSYYPNIPQAGNDVLLYFELCDIGLTNCTPCQSCFLDGYFTNEKGEKKVLFSNISTNTTEAITFIYPGRRVEVKLNFEEINYKYDTFYIPKLSFYESIIYAYNESHTMAILSIISLLVFVIGIPYSLLRIIKNARNKFSSISERKRKIKIKKMLS